MKSPLLFICVLASAALVTSTFAKTPRAVDAPADLGSKIAFSSNRDASLLQIYVMNPDGSSQTRVTNSPRDDNEPSLSPNADKIAFVRADPNGSDVAFHIYTINVNGTGETRLTNDYELRPVFSPDGSKIVFLSQRAADNYAYQIYVMNSDGSNQVNVSQNSSVFDFDPSFSPDGSKIVFASGYRVGLVLYLGIFVMDADGSNRRRLSGHPPGQFWGDRRPSFSPDGSKIVFESTNGDGLYGIAIMNADGTDQTLLSYQTGDSRPSFSSEGSKIVFSRYSTAGTSNDQIYTMNLDGTNVQSVSNNGLHDFEPSWSPGPTTADLSIASITDSPDPVPNRADVRYRITVRNSGPDTARFVRTNITVQNGTFIRSDLPYTSANGVFTFVRSLLRNNEEFYFDVVVAANQSPPNQVQLNAAVASNATDPLSANNSGAGSTSIVSPPPPPPPGDLGPTPFVINESLDPGPNLADTILHFAGGQSSRAAGFSLRVQQTTTPGNEPSWTTLPEGGLMMLEAAAFDPQDTTSVQLYSFNTTAYLNANGVYFRAIASAPGHTDSISNVVPDPAVRPGLNLASKRPRLQATVFRIAGLAVPRGILPGQKIPFLAVQRDHQVPGLEVRVQTSTSPRDGQSWKSLPGGVMTISCTPDVDPNFCTNGTTNFFHVRSSAYQTGDVYFRAISSAPGYVDSISKAIGPFQLTRDEVPEVLLTPPEPSNQKAANSGAGDTPEVLLVTVNATDPDGTVAKVTLYVDGQPFLIKESPPWVFDIATLPPGRHSLDAVAWDNLGGPGFSNHVGDYFVSNEGGFTFDRIADGAWNEATAWTPAGVPGPNDVARIFDRTVDLNGASVSVTSLMISGGRINGPGSVTPRSAFVGGPGSASAFVETVLANLTLTVPADGGLLFVDSPTSAFDGAIAGLVRFNNITLNNHGRAILSGNQLLAQTSVIYNFGVCGFGNQLRNGFSGRRSGGSLGTVENRGTLDLSGAVVQATQLVQVNGQIITGADIVAGGGGNIVAGGGGNIVAGGGLNDIDPRATPLIGNDGAGLLGQDGASVVSNDGAGLVGQDGAGMVAGLPGGGLNPSGSDHPTPPRILSTEPLVRLLGGSVTGNGLIAGDVDHAAGAINVGNSPGAIAISGNYLQGSGASLVLDFSGRNGLAGQYDLLKIRGAANLSGTLSIAALPGAGPGQTAIVPLSYGTVTGGLTVTGSNAQIAFNSTGAIVTAQVSAPLALTSVVSRKTHGGAGTFDLPVSLTDANAVECRSGGTSGNHTLVYTFDSDVISGNASVTGIGSVSGTPTFSANTMTVLLTGVQDARRLTVTVSNVTGAAAQVLPDTSVTLGFLVGDTTRNGSVTASDISQTKSQSGQPLTASNFFTDVNVSGTINASDIGLVKAEAGTQIMP